MLSITEVTRTYQRREAVSHVSLELAPGKTYALLGPNGSGKTTLMKMVAGLTRPTSGDIRLDGAPIGPITKAHIAYMPTESYFYNYMTVQDAGKYYADFFRDFDFGQFQAMLERMALNPKDKVRQLSSGMNAKLRLALTLSRDAQLMMFDEPLNGVDILTRTQVISEITRRRDSGRIMLLSTHLVEEIEALLDEVIFMKDGVIVKTGTREALTAEGSTLTDLYLRIYGQGEAMVC